MNAHLIASLEFHTPQTIYAFLKRYVGPLHIIIKGGLAFIHFVQPAHANQALNKYSNFMLLGNPLRLYPYNSDNINNPPSLAALKGQPQNKPELLQRPKKLSEFTMLIQDSLKITDTENQVQSITKNNRRQIMEFVNSYNVLFQTAQARKQELVTEFADSQQKKKIEEFYGFYKHQLAKITQNLKKEFKNLRKRCANYNKQQSNIELQPSIQIASPVKKNIEHITSFKGHLQYISTQGFEVKRIAALNDEHFAVTETHKRQNSRLKFYKVDDEYPETTCQIKQGAYGLLVLDSHILVGTFEGNIAFFNINDLNSQEVSVKLHNNGAIFDLARLSKDFDSYKVISLGLDKCLKIWRVTHESYTQNASTLFFDQAVSLTDNLNLISSIDVLNSCKIAYSRQKSIFLHDCQTNTLVTSQNTNRDISKVIRLDQDCIAATNEKYISFVDLRNNAKSINYNLLKLVRTVAALSQYTTFYGCFDGEVGIIDRRIDTKNYWRVGAVHKHTVYDICRMGEMVVTGDKGGQLASWLPNESLRNTMVAQYR